MENTNNMFKTCTIDEANRVLLPADLRNQQNWEAGTTLTVFANLTEKFVEFLKQDVGQYMIDSHGRIKLTDDLKASMGWNTGDKLHVRLNSEAGGISLSLCTRHIPGCDFCVSADVVYELNGVQMCKNCIQRIKESGY